jgi:hypothetical protein
VDAHADSHRLRRAGLVGALTLGFGLFGAGLHGLTSVDARLEAATERQRENFSVERDWGDCPEDRERDRDIERERL